MLAGNRSSYNIVYDALDMDYSARNATILQVLDLLMERGETWRDRLPIVLAEDGTYQYAEDSESAIAALQESLELAEYATAEDCMSALTRRYDCQGYSREDARNVVSVRYSMTQDGFSRTSPYVIAEDVSAETVGVISEHASEWPGIETRVAVTRTYGEDGSLAPTWWATPASSPTHSTSRPWRTATPTTPRTTSPATSGATPWAAPAWSRL